MICQHVMQLTVIITHDALFAEGVIFQHRIIRADFVCSAEVILGVINGSVRVMLCHCADAVSVISEIPVLSIFGENNAT